MSSGEKRSWIYAVINVGVPAAYFAIVLGRLSDAGAGQIAYVRPMLTAIGVAIVLNIVANTAAGIGSGKEKDRRDERDKQINRFGEYIGFYVVSVFASVPLFLAMAKAEYFWIANSLYLAFVVAAVVSSVVKIVAYRRGF